VPQLQNSNDAAMLAKIEQMLAQGASEEQIVASLGGAPAAPPAASGLSQPMMKEPGDLRPLPPRMEGWPAYIREILTGVKNPLDMSSEEFTSSIPLPFTDLRMNTGDAMGAVAGGMGMLKAGQKLVPKAVGALMENLPSRRAMAANSWANEAFPSRLTNPQRLLPPNVPTGNFSPLSRPGFGPQFPHGMIDDIPTQTPDLPPGFTDFINQEAFPETAVMGTMPPVKFINVGQGATKKAATSRALQSKTKKKK
jgi:hypothetical protein